MVQLHVWGDENGISVISPECLASAWLLTEKCPKDLTIITSNNTNFSDIGQLPVLIDGENKYNGYKQICDYVASSRANSVKKDEDSVLQLFDSSLITLLIEKFDIINQYNLYVNTKNYEKFTRKLFQNYLPFPMMYNQPLKYYNHAQNQIKLVGLGVNKVGFFNFSGAIALTETVNDDEEEENDQVALSALHEREILRKSKQKGYIQESKNSLRCLNLINHYLQQILSVYKQYDIKNYNHRLLLVAYIMSFSHEKLPDRFIYNYLKENHGDFYKEISDEFANLRYETRAPTGYETPNLLNEIKHITGVVKY